MRYNPLRFLDLEDLVEGGVTGDKQLIMPDQTFTVSCGSSTLPFFVVLTRGQYIQVRSEDGPIAIRIGCGNLFQELVRTYTLQHGQAVQVICLACLTDVEDDE